MGTELRPGDKNVAGADAPAGRDAGAPPGPPTEGPSPTGRLVADVPAMVSALLVGAVASGALVVGAVVGAVWDVPEPAVGATLAFASGALFTAVAFDLFAEAVRGSAAWLAGAGLFAGSLLFTAVDWLIDEYVGGGEGVGLALAASVTLDGVPENVALGVALVGGAGSVPLALLAAIVAANFPEALDGARFIVREGKSRAYAVGLWTGVGALLAAAVVAGRTVFADLPEATLALVHAFAAGAVLAAVADETLPDAYEEGGPAIALATTAGFFLTFLLQ